jgi:TetR/AcrR family transcriptional repressor of nem operon
VTRILEPAFALDIDPLERIARFFHSVADQQRASVVRGCPFGNLAAELGTQDDVIRARVRLVFDGYLAYFERALRDAKTSGHVRDVDVPSAARALLALVQGALLLAKTNNDASVIDALADQALGLVAGTQRLESA